ncbi:MAG: RteC domain-containing protein [Ferruginibacter sp.]
MNLRSGPLYARMQEEIEAVEASGGNEMICVEKCFSIALAYWSSVRIIAETNLFSTEAEEIFFFKHIKPAFIAVMEYYMLLYQAILFKPATDKDALLSYWLKQLKRADQFLHRHQAFRNYYCNGLTELDAMYFTLRQNSIRFTGRFIPAGRPGCCQGSYLAAGILAYQRYQAYLECQLKAMTEGSRKKVLSGPLIPA